MHLKPFDHKLHSVHVGFPVLFQVCSFMRNSVRPPVGLPVVSLSMPYASHTHLVFALLLKLLHPRAHFVARYICSLALSSILVYVTLREVMC